MTSYIWRSTADADADLLGLRTAVDAEVIEFTATNVVDGKHIHEHSIDLPIGFAENEKPKLNVNEIQDTFLEGVIFTVTGTIENPSTNPAGQTVKEWVIEAKTNTLFSKGRFGIELADFGSYDVIPAAIGGVEQPRGLILVDWKWIRNGTYNGKADFIATLRFNGDFGVSTTTPKYDWTVRYV